MSNRSSTSVSATGSIRPSTAILITDFRRPTPPTCIASPASRSMRRSRCRWSSSRSATPRRAIANGDAPEVAGDSYLYVGDMIGDLAITYDWCSTLLTPSQRTRWAAYAEQAVTNVWNPDQAEWGGQPFPWSGWSIDDPANNYFYSFLEATMFWTLADDSATVDEFPRHRQDSAADRVLRRHRRRQPGRHRLRPFAQAALQSLSRLARFDRRRSGERKRSPDRQHRLVDSCNGADARPHRARSAIRRAFPNRCSTTITAR